MLKVLNLYAGLGGNRKSWTNVQVTAVEMDAEIASIYKENFPQDEVIVGDAHAYLLAHYREFDFIWSSPPCPSHSRIRQMASKKGDYKEVYPDLKLYEEIIFLQGFCGVPWVVENVRAYYTPLIKPRELHRHWFWANFPLSDFKTEHDVIIKQVSSSTEVFGFSLKGKKLSKRKDQILRNCVNPALGLHILECAFKKKQQVLTTTDEAKASGVETLRTPPTTEVVGIRAGDIL